MRVTKGYWKDGEFDKIPSKGKHSNWKESVGIELTYIYRDKEFNVTILEYIYKPKVSDIRVECNGVEKTYGIGHFKNGKIGTLIGYITSDHIYEVGDVLKSETRDLTIIDCLRDSGKDYNGKVYKIYCNKCGFDSSRHYRCGEYNEEYTTKEGHLKRGRGCPCCSSEITSPNINSIAITRPDVAKFLLNKSDGYTYSDNSHYEVDFKCDKCKSIRICSMELASKRGFICDKCSDGISFPEKFMSSVLSQLNLNFRREVDTRSLKWGGIYRYDFMIDDNIIVETNGMQHYKDSSGSTFTKTLEEEKANDKNKEELAIKNGIKYYISVDCRYSDGEYIKNSILNSKLNELYDLKGIDWVKCLEATNTVLLELVQRVKLIYPDAGTSFVANELNISKGIVRKLLKKGASLNMFHYNPKEEMRKSALANRKVNNK